jgi:hypothetical protein
MELDALPGFRRRLLVTPSPGMVRSDVEDDYHRMSVAVRHDGQVATRVEGEVFRAPWTTCPGARAVLEHTFAGVRLDAFGRQGEKVTNCTHLYDLAVLAAAHAHDTASTIYDILVADAVGGVWRAELRCNGARVLGWDVADGVITAPVELAGMRLDGLRSWIASLDPVSQEHAKLLRWGTMLAHGRARRFAPPTEPRPLPIGQCFSFQPENAPHVVYVEGSFHDFSGDTHGPLESRDVTLDVA